MFRVVNIKKDNPECEYAQFLAEKEIVFASRENIDVLIIIHGYGSNGVGGAIKRTLRKRLKVLQKIKIIDSYVGGEYWSKNNLCTQKILNKYPNLDFNSQVGSINSGITLINLK